MPDINPDYLAGLAKLETQNGTRTAGANNLYNIKDFSGGGTQAYDKAEKSNDRYRNYASPEDSTADLVGLLQRKYPAALTASTPGDFAQALKDGGYATDPNYVSKLTSVITGGKFTPVAMAAANFSKSLRAVGPGMTITQAGELDEPLSGPGNRAKARKGINFDSDGNQVNLTGLEKAGVLHAGVTQGPEAALAARHDPDAAALLGAERTTPNANVPDQFDTEQRQETALQQAETEKNAVSMREQFGAASLNDGFIRAIVQKVAGTDEHGPALPGYTPPQEVYDGKTEDERSELAAATNPGHLAAIQFEQDEAKGRAKTLSSLGPIGQFGMGALATLGDPLSYVLPYGAARALKFAGVGSAVLAESGQGAAAAASAFGENAVAGVAQTHIAAAAAGEHVSNGDDFAGAAFALAPAILHGYSGWSAAHRQVVAKAHLDAINTVVAKEERDAAKAMGNLGPDATVDQVRAEMDRIQAAEISDTAKGNVTSPVSADRQLMPHPDAIKAELEAEATAEAPVLYHGTEQKFDAADFKGGMFTADKERAQNYAGMDGKSGHVLSATLDIKNPMPWDQAFGKTPEEIKAAGFDGAIQTGPDGKITRAVVTDAKQIKEAPEPKTVKVEEEAPISAGNEDARGFDAGTDQKTFKTEKATFFNDTGSPQVRRYLAENDPKWISAQKGASEGLTIRDIDKLDAGVHVRPELAETPHALPALRATEELVRRFLPGSKVVIGSIDLTNEQIMGGARKQFAQAGRNPADAPGPNALVQSYGRTHIIGLNTKNTNPTEAIASMIHEVGHAVFHETASKIPAPLLARMVAEHGEFLAETKAGKASARFKRASEGSHNVLDADGKLRAAATPSEYNNSFDEYTAEAFVRYIQRKARDTGDTDLNLGSGALHLLRAAWEKVKQVYEYARGKGWLAKDEAFGDYFDSVLKGTLADAGRVADSTPEYLDAGLQMNFAQGIPSKPGVLPAADATAVKHGLDLLPEASPSQAGEKKMITALYQRADAWAKANPKDAAWDKRASQLTDNGVFNVASTGLLMLKSQNPVIRMVAAELLEDAGGVVGHRNSTAAISKHLHERLFLGNTVNDLQDTFSQWKKDNGGSLADDLMTGKGQATFNRLIAEEIESRRANDGRTTGAAHAAVIQAADSLEKSYDRMRLAQVRGQTLGWAGLPETSKGYMPHKMSSSKVRELTNAQTGVLHSALVDQFVGVEGWDITFAANLAGKYIDRVKQKALGGYDAAIGIHQTSAADIVEDSMQAMGLTRQEIAANMQRYYKAGPGYTKGRINLDLLKEHQTPEGNIRLLDLFDTDQMHLLRTQAHRVSGEVALARHGVYGKPGMALLRRAMGYGADGEKAVPKELEAFDQVASEFFGEPFGTQEGKWMERARTLNSVARLGGIVFNQFAEFINGAAHVGVGRTLSAIGSIARLRGEIIALAKGESVNNSLLESIEHVGGAEFGTDAYKISFPYAHPDAEYPTYGRDTITATDRILRGAAHVQSKISFWRAIHSAQNRGFAEQIVQKAAQFIKNGGDDAALNDMGIHAGIRARLGADIDKIATFDGAGRLTSFDLMRASDTQAAADFAQAIHRGVSQIIQGTFIGETGKWAHSGYLKMLTQFRTFSITSVEKQWARQRNNQGTAKALGILVGSMSIAVPVYMARVYANSIGRSDQADYIEKQLSPYKLTRATMNYVALSGLAGDFSDALTAIAPDAIQEKLGGPTGGRSGTTTSAVGNLIAPAAGYVDDVWGALQNLDKPSKAMKVLPFSRVPFLVPAINALGDQSH